MPNKNEVYTVLFCLTGECTDITNQDQGRSLHPHFHTRILVGWTRMYVHDDPQRLGMAGQKMRLLMTQEVLHGLPGILQWISQGQLRVWQTPCSA